jgi:hypothetical protein
VVLRFFLQVQNSFNAKDIAQAQSVIRGKKKEEQKNSMANQLESHLTLYIEW